MLGFDWARNCMLRCGGDITLARGDIATALIEYRKSLQRSWDFHDLRYLCEALIGVATVSVTCGDAERGVRLLAAALTLREKIRVLQRWTVPIHAQTEAKARGALSPDAFMAAWNAGTSMPLALAVADALATATDVSTRTHASETPEADAVIGLTTRECDVLRGLAKGLSNRDIADDLVISPRTVNFHVTNVLAKLDLPSRTAAAVFAIRHGMN